MGASPAGWRGFVRMPLSTEGSTRHLASEEERAAEAQAAGFEYIMPGGADLQGEIGRPPLVLFKEGFGTVRNPQLCRSRTQNGEEGRNNYTRY